MKRLLTLTLLIAIFTFCATSFAQAQTEKWKNETVLFEFKTTAGKMLGGGYVATVDPIIKNNLKKVVIVSTNGVEELDNKGITVSEILKKYQNGGWEPYSEQLFASPDFPRMVMAYSFRKKMK